MKIIVRGAVQGVGFRPFVYRLATEAGLTGWVNNSAQGVFIEAEGAREVLESFLLRVATQKPPRSSIQSLEPSWLDSIGYTGFEIRASEAGGAKTTLVLPDIATCADCLAEIFDPHNRRYSYPFTNCTNCGPRFSIIEALPYDRANTSMRRFTMCPACQAEYDNPLDRRFHAQPNACPVCGPHLELWDAKGSSLLVGSSSAEQTRVVLSRTADLLREGQIVAVKGLGGFHLMVAAHLDQAVQRLRQRKHREEKPFALMFPTLATVKAACEVSPLEERLLLSPESPIVLLRSHASPVLRSITAEGGRITHLAPPLSSSLAPGNPNLGVMLPATPLHHLLLAELGFPVVATSGNLSDEPICTDEREALERLGGIADFFLVHDRPIVRHVDDSIARLMLGREILLRRARGYAPLPIALSAAGLTDTAENSVLAVGAHLKNSVALAVGSQAFISQHIGDLETAQSFDAFRRVIADFQKLYETSPQIIAADAHPDYLSTKHAAELCARNPDAEEAPKLIHIQHHVAHVFSCMAENQLDTPVLGVAWDGTGFGLDGTIWGGEFFFVTVQTAERVGYLRPFRLPGGDAAVKEPRRTALGLLHELLGDDAFARTELAPLQAFAPSELSALNSMLVRGVNSPHTSSVGRLFDAVASLAGLRQQVRFEGQAAMELEFAIDPAQPTSEAYPTEYTAGIVDWSPLVTALIADLTARTPLPLISARFHNGLAEALIAVAKYAGEPRVVLSGGCFQNRYLTERVVLRLREEGFQPYWHQRVPPNDGGIALGQIVGAWRARRRG